jgi:ADP-ribosyl-[dinitrogen reductase] hydrolase
MNNTNKHEHFLSKGRSLIPAIAYGDAAGLPVETRSAEYIAEHYGVINKLIPTSENPFYRGTYEPGLWSDDTQLTLAVAEGLIEADGFDISTQVTQHINAYDSTPEMERRGIFVKRGWGGSTTGAMERLKQGVTPDKSGTKDGAGNGVLMKMAPLAYWQVARHTTDEERFNQYDTLTTMTHDSDVARMTTRIHGDMLISLTNEGYEKEQFLDTLYRSIGRHAFELSLNEKDYHIMFEYLEGDVTKETIQANTDRKGFYAPQTLTRTYGAFIAHDGDAVPSIYEAVNLGGDTDSAASIAASMAVLATKNTIYLPYDHQQIGRLSMIRSVSRKLAVRANRSIKS